jgi:histidyl-tRNA synthetase
MDIRYKRPKGTRDVMLEEMERWRWCEDRWRVVLERFGYGEIRTPIIEPTDLFTRSVGEGTDIVDKEMYSFQTRGKEHLTLRPEATASVVRAYLENGLTRQPGTLKFYYMGPMFRYDRPQAGRYRQFHQVGLEAIGSDSPVLDAEVIRTALALFEAVDAENLLVQINTIGCPECRPAYVDRLREFCRENAEGFCATCQTRIEKNPLRLFDCKVEECQQLLGRFEPISEAVCDVCKSHHEAVSEALEAMGIEFENDPSLVRGLDYYTRTTFEISLHQDLRQSTLCGGGRYDGLIGQCGGPETPAIGFSMGVERTIRLLYPDVVDFQRSRQTNVDIYIVCMGRASETYALKHADRLRGVCRVEVDSSGRGVKAQMKSANTRNARFVMIAGDDEVTAGSFQLKDLTTGEQEEVPASEILARVREVLDK